MLSCPARSSCTFPLPRQLTISKPRDPSSSKRQLHQMAQLKGLMTSALVTSYAHKTWEREQRATAKNIALGKKKKKEKVLRKKEVWVLVQQDSLEKGPVSGSPSKLLSCFSLTDGRGDRRLRNVRSQCIAHVEGSSTGSSKTEPLFLSLIKELLRIHEQLMKYLRLKKTPKIWCLVVAKPK